MNIAEYSPEIQEKYWNLSQDIRDYIDNSFQCAEANGIDLTLHGSRYESLSIVSENIIINNFSGYFFQSLYGMPTDNTFFNVTVNGIDTHQFNFNRQCQGIPIWDTNALLQAAGYCSECGQYVGIENLRNYIYAGSCCSDCLPAIQAEIDSKPSGYWTS